MRPSKIKNNVHGWLILDKQKGLTSTQALGRARRAVGGSKVGHGGTLDPLATGILPLAFGEATKLIPYVMDGDKEYEFTIRWGEQRDTDDAEGKVIATSAVRPSEKDIRNALPAFTGIISQTPPAFSAIKLDGARAYDIARAGGSPEIAARDVVIHTLELINVPDTDRAAFHVTCGKGMYVRALARDLASRLGTCGTITELRRTRVGQFTLGQSVKLEKLEVLAKESNAFSELLALRAALGDIPPLTLTAAEAHKLRLGQGVLIRPQHADAMEIPVVFAEHEGLPVALVEPKGGEFRVIRGFHF